VDFEQAVTATHRGIIVVCNILDAVSANVLPRDVAVKFVKLWRQVFEILSPDGEETLPDDIVDQITTIVQPALLKKKFGIESDRDFRFCVLADPPSEALATVTLAGFLEKMLDRPSLVELSANGHFFPYKATATGARTAVDRLKSLPEEWRHFRFSPEGLGDRTLWVTMSERLAAALAGPDDGIADRARDVLGLVDLERDDVVVLVGVPSGPLAERKRARPTVLDGGNRRFTGVPRDPPEALGEGWGWTFDLRALFGAAERQAGLPECICEGWPSDAFAGEPSSFTVLGVIELPRKDPVGVGDDRFAELLRQPRSRDDLMAELAALV
jgi:hypothetical protein